MVCLLQDVPKTIFVIKIFPIKLQIFEVLIIHLMTFVYLTQERSYMFWLRFTQTRAGAMTL